MPAVKRILLATDLSPASVPAAEFAQRLASTVQGEVLLFHAVPWIPVPMEGAFEPQTYDRLMRESREEAVTALDRLGETVRVTGVSVAVRVSDGPAGSRIIEAVTEWRADVVVVGTHGRTGLNRILVGSVAEQVLQLAPCPVITVRPLPRSWAPDRRPLTRVIYPTDFSPAARRAWPWARAVAEAAGADIDLLHVMLEPVPDRHVDPAFVARAAEAIRRDAQKAVDEFLAGCGFPRERITVDLTTGVEADQIARRAEARRADLIVMGTHGRTGVLRLALGSVARRVLHTAPCAVLTVSPHVAD
ncbi:MAG TPA: universal stress protein [Methylomirabilota bacterium]|nr:universal stress protein [Methylomirabilota bacterium]